MKPITPEEISALLDGELPPERAAEVRRAIAENDEWRQLFDQLAATDQELRAYVVACRFQPRVALLARTEAISPMVFAFALGLLALRFLTKLIPFGPGIIIQAAAAALVFGWLLWRFVPTIEAAVGLASMIPGTMNGRN